MTCFEQLVHFNNAQNEATILIACGIMLSVVNNKLCYTSILQRLDMKICIEPLNGSTTQPNAINSRLQWPDSISGNIGQIRYRSTDRVHRFTGKSIYSELTGDWLGPQYQRVLSLVPCAGHRGSAGGALNPRSVLG